MIKHIISPHANHRLVVVKDDKIVAAGFWTSYTGIAQVEYEGKVYLACTAYYEGVLPVGTPFTVTEVA